MEENTESHNDIEIVKKMEDEHLRLQRQFRDAQTDHQQRTMGVHPQFRSQDQLLKILKDEYTSLHKDLKIARSGRHKKNDKKMKSDLQRALLHRIQSEQNCEGGYSIMDEFDGLLRLKAKEMLALRKLAIANEGELDARRCRSENSLMSAENKLEAATLRFDAIQCENRNIREEIEHMLKDRALFNQAWDKMLSALSTGKKFLSDLFESSTLAYDQRDEWCHKLRSIQEKGRMDQMLQVQEMRDLKKAFDHETKIYNFLAKKGIKRINTKEEEREMEEKRLNELKAEKQLNEHDKILDDIFDYCDQSCYEDIIQHFKRIECENFSAYKLLTDYCAENEVLARDLHNIQRDIMDRRDFNEQRVAHEEQRIEELQKKLGVQQTRTDELRKKRENQDQRMQKMMSKFVEMFQLLDCSLEPFQNLLGDKQPSLYTTKLTLFLITQKIKEYVEIVFFSERATKRPAGTKEAPQSRLKKYTIRSDMPVIFSPMPLSLLVPSDPCPSCIETRWLSRVSEAAEKPFGPGDAERALAELTRDPAYVRSDRVHALADCRASASRRLLATRHAQY